jgi:putative two-component system response regulator
VTATVVLYRGTENEQRLKRQVAVRADDAMVSIEVPAGRRQELLLDASTMHDIGKVAIPDRVLLKPGKLDDDELAIMQKHAMYGYELLKDSTSPLLQAGATIALGHHEKFDGSGYPQGQKGQDIPLFCRIVAVADVFDALTSSRPYKAAWSLERSVEYLRTCRGTHFDPQCVDAFLGAWSEVLTIRDQFADPQTA